jgi:lipopolysaccharide heptosyltransferase II
MKYRNILITRTDRIGDVVLSLPMLAKVRQRYPKAKISMLVRQYTQSLVADHRCLDSLITLEVLGSWLQSYRLIRKKRYDTVILAFPRFRLALLFFLARIPVRVGTGYRWYSFLFNRRVYEHRKDARFHELEYNLHLLEQIGCKSDTSIDFSIHSREMDTLKVVVFLDQNHISTKDRLVVLHAGSGGSARDWPPERFAELGRRLLKRGLKVLLTGSSEEKALVESISSNIGDGCINAAGAFSLRELAALFVRTYVMAANSTGPLHIAAAVGTPVVGFSPPIVQCSPARWGPYTEKKLIFVPDKSKCTECAGRPCRSSRCMEQITVDDVEQGVLYLIEKYAQK